MNKWLLLFLLASPTVVKAELVQPNFTQGSMNSTTTTTIDIDEEIVTTTYGAALQKWSGVQYNSFISKLWRNSRFRFSLQSDNSWLRFHARNSKQSSQSDNRKNRDRSNYRTGNLLLSPCQSSRNSTC